ncbi:phytoene desaturase family protein [soil metagenome]
MANKKIIIIGSGFAGLSAACFMAKAGCEVTVLEKQATPGGRARQLKAQGFTFDMGPSWYWMTDVFEHFFNAFGKNVSDYYTLHRLDPSYRVYGKNNVMDIPAGYEALKVLFEKLEPDSAKQLDKFLEEAQYKYKVGINKLVHKPGQSLNEFLDWDLLTGIFRLDVFNSIKTHVGKHFKHPAIRQLMEFPVLFLGALPEKTPALYSLMNYADIKGGTWYPEGGMYSIVKAIHTLALELGVNFCFEHDVREIIIEKNAAKRIVAVHKNELVSFEADAVIGGADYHHIESALLPDASRSYTEAYWDKRVMAPGCLIYFVGLNKKLNSILHHSLFFDTSFEQHGREIYKTKEWPKDPLFYVSATSVTDSTVAPEGCENLFFLVPVAAGLADDTEEKREYYFDKIVKRMEQKTGQNIRDHIIYKKTYAHSDFVHEYNAFKGNAYGLANTLMQTAILKPSCRSRKVKNLFYTGQLTVPGPGVPPSLISGEVVAKEVLKSFKNQS